LVVLDSPSHQWTPPIACHMFHPFNEVSLKSVGFQDSIAVENYITHNGAFDFFELNGKTYDLSAIQGWLAKATGALMPTVVDSAAVAGMLDMLRTQGCFALSFRYALCLKLSSSSMDDGEFPTNKVYAILGKEFETILVEFKKLKGHSIDDLAASLALQREPACLMEK
jgi:hypothetical protein